MKFINIINKLGMKWRTSTPATPPVQTPPELMPTLIAAAQLDATALLTKLSTTRHGISQAEAQLRHEQYGDNTVAHEKPCAWYQQLFQALLNPFIGVLISLGIVSFCTDIVFAAPQERSYQTIIIISAMITLSTLLRFWQEFRSNQAALQLKAMVCTTAAVLRTEQPKPQEKPLAEIVPGDIVYLSAGDMIPADVRLLSAKDLFVSQSALTGEATPIEKSEFCPPGVGNHANNLLALPNICFLGTNIVSGSATAVVVATGSQTYFGAMAKSLVGTRVMTSFDKGVNSVSWMLIRFMLIMVPVVFFINGFTKGDWIEALLFSISVAVGLTPEMLPMIVTANLAKGAVRMAKHKTIVKRLNAIQNFGAMNILCTDKTGTLTQDRIILERHLDVHGETNLEVLKYAYLNSFYQTGLKNLLDVAVMEYGEKNGLQSFPQTYHKVDEIPFDFSRRRMSVIVADQDHDLLICKGAVEEMLSICSHVDMFNTTPVLLTEAIKATVKATAHQLNQEGMRVLAVAYKTRPASSAATYTTADETGLILVGYLAFLDPPKETARLAIQALHEHGVAVKVITGDNEVVTQKICEEVGLPINNILLGEQIATLSDQDLATAAEHTTVFAKVSPLQKAQIIQALQSKNHTVGHLGDGINDAPALQAADIGISVDTAVDIAKESADIILLEKSLMVLEQGILAGRQTFGNIIKYIKLTASSNFGNVLSVLVASAFLPFLPMLPIHLLIQNLLYDISQIAIPWDKVDQEYLEKPRKWEARGIARFMLFIGPISSIFDIITYSVMWFVFGAKTPATQAIFQSGWFIEGLISQTLIVYMIRTRKIPFIQSMPATPVLLLTIAVMAVGVYIPFSPLGASIGLAALPNTYFLWLGAILLSYCTLTQLAKQWYIARFKQWL